MKDEERPDLRRRTKEFALKIVRLYSSLPNNTAAQVLGRQLLKSGTSSGAHYREAQRAKSDADMVSKVEGALQELEESDYWLELLTDAQFAPAAVTGPLRQEAQELIAILVTIVRKVKARKDCA